MGTLDNAAKVAENRVRRMAARRGYVLERARVRDPGARGFDSYRLVRVVFAESDAAGGYGKSLGQVEDWLEKHSGRG